MWTWEWPVKHCECGHGSDLLNIVSVETEWPVNSASAMKVAFECGYGDYIT